MNVPNMITIFRMFLIPVFVWVYFSNPDENLLLAVVIFVTAGVTDVLDGYIARKYNLVTKFGTVMDPLADKLMLLTAIISFSITRLIPIWILLVILIKEGTMIIGGYFIYREGIINPANKVGKLATFMFHVSIVSLLFSKTVGVYLLVISALIGLVAAYKYLVQTLEKRKNPSK